MTIKAITFDFWSTLYEAKTVDYTQRLYQLKAIVEQFSDHTFELEQFQAAVNEARETWRRTWLEEYRTLTADDWLQIALKKLGVLLAPEHFFSIKIILERSVLNDLPTPVPEVKTALADLSAQYQLAIISDTGLTPGRILRQVLENDNLAPYFTHFTFSDEVGRSKPHALAFLTTLEALGVKPNEAAHVGDLLHTDIVGAQQVGMRAVQYIGVNEDTEDNCPASCTTTVIPDGVIKSHTELAPLLRQWNSQPQP